MRKRLIIVDGYNILRSGKRYAAFSAAHPDYTDDTFNAARDMLIKDISLHVDSRTRVMVVFDGNREKHEGEASVVGNVEVVFSSAQSSADHIIEKTVRQACEQGMEVLVVTNDSTIRNTISGLGVSRMSADNFSDAAFLAHEDIHEYTQPVVAQKHTISERLNEETRLKLEALRNALGQQLSIYVGRIALNFMRR